MNIGTLWIGWASVALLLLIVGALQRSVSLAAVFIVPLMGWVYVALPILGTYTLMRAFGGA